MKQFEAILDIGSSKVICLMGDCNSEGRFEVYGISAKDHRGLRRRMFVDESTLETAIKQTISAVQTEARRRIKKVYVSIPGEFIKLFCKQGELQFSAFRTITENDIDALVDASRVDIDRPEGYTHIHGTPVSFRCDGKPRTVYPVGTSAKSIWAAVSHVYMANEFKELISDMLEEIGVQCEAFVYGGYASGMLLIPQKRRPDDSIILDVGYYHTELCIIRNCAPIYHQVLLVGGHHLSSDVSQVMGISSDIAEAIKRRHVFGLDYSNRVDSYRLTDGKIESCEYIRIQEIIELRAEEMAQMIQDVLDESPVELLPNTPMYLCGGGMAMMRGSREFLQAQLNRPVSTDIPWLPRMNSANYVSAYGMLNYVCNSGLSGESALSELKSNRLFKGLVDFFTK